jgi:hypothetical protein
MLECNIDARGKAVRLLSGLASLAAGLVLLSLSAAGVLDGQLVAVAAGAAVLGGGFAIFEARAGWCALRAMGIKTPL